MFGRIPTRLAKLAAAVLLVVGAMAIMAGTASALTKRWVSPTPSAAGTSNGTSCSSPGYNHIQEAIDAGVVGRIMVCSGTYEEQLTITKATSLQAEGTPNIKLPADVANSATSCDAAINAATKGRDEDLVSICTEGREEEVTIKGITFEAEFGSCDDNIYGILVAGKAKLSATSTTVDGAGGVIGCQGGVGIEVGASGGGQVGHAVLSKDTVAKYNKNGITVDGVESTLTVKSTVVTGDGVVGTAQNGIQVSRGAEGTIEKATVSANECSQILISNCGPEDEQATGVLFYSAAAGSSISTSTINGNDLGIYYGSGSATQPATPEVEINGNKLNANRYEGVYLEQGSATVNADKIAGPGLDGIYLNQGGWQSPLAVEATATKDKITGMTEAAVYVWGSPLETDIPGHFTIENSKISPNKNEIINLNPGKFTVTSKNNT